MKTIEHSDYSHGNVCIYEHTKTKIRGSFFGKEKPEVGDLITTAFQRDSYKVINIIENRDAKVSSTCNKNPKGAYFVLEVELFEN